MKTFNFCHKHPLGRALIWLVMLQMMFFQCLPAVALPEGEQVRHGAADFVRDGNTLTINQATSKAIVNYQSFSIGAPETVQFMQPGADAAILNRVIGNSFSDIAGSLLANGNVYLINPNGILFSSSARVNVGGLVASALNMRDDDFLAGRLFFSGGSGTVINEGALNANLVYLIGSQVENRGSIGAPEVVLAAGQRSVLIDRAAGGEIRLVIDGEDAAVEGEEELAEGLAEEETPAGDEAADVVADAVDETTDDVAADTAVADEVVDVPVEVADNEIDLGVASVEDLVEEIVAATGFLDGELPETTVDPLAEEVVAVDALESMWDAGTVINQGVIDASGDEGGTIVIAGLDVVQGGDIHADGTAGGGGSITILAEDVLVFMPESRTTANAGANGDGGTVIAVAENNAHFLDGSVIEVRGGSESGDGGFAEVSGRNNLQFGGTVDATAENGEMGSVLFDPGTLFIDDADGGGGDQDVNLPAILAGDTNTTFNVVTWGAIEEQGAAANIILEATNLISILDINSGASNSVGDVVSLSLSTGSLTIRATGLLGDVLFSDVDDTIRTEGGSISIEAGDDIIVGNLDTTGAGGTEAGTISVVSTGAAGSVLGNSLTSGGSNITATSLGSVMFTNLVDTGGGDLTVSGNTFVDLEAIDTGGGNADIDAGAALDVRGDTDLGGGSGALDATAGSTITFGGTVTNGSVTAHNTGGDIDFQGVVDTRGGSLSVTSNTGTILFQQNVSSGGGDITAAAVNALSLGADLASGAGTISLTISGGGITQTGGAVSGADLVFDAAGAVDLGQAGNDVGAVAGTADGTITLADGGDLTVGTVGATAGLDSNGNDIDVTAASNLVVGADVDAGAGNIFLTSTAGDISQTGGAVTADELEVVSGGAAVLVGTTNNNVNTVAGTAAGLLSYADADDLVVGATTGQTGLSGDGVTLSVNGDLDVNEMITSTGGNVDLTADADLSGAGKITIVEAINTGGGDFNALAFEFENDDGGADNGTITTDGGNVDIFAESVALIAGDILAGTGIDINISISAPSLTLEKVDLDTGGVSPPTVIGGGYVTKGKVDLLGGGIITLNQNFPDLIIDGQVVDFGTDGGTLNAARDIILINGGSLVSMSDSNVTVLADSDGLINTNMLGAAYGGVYVDGSSSIDAGGTLTILGAESLTNAGYAILIEGSVVAGSNLVVNGRNPVTAGTQPATDVGIAGSLVSSNGSITILAQRDAVIDGTVDTLSASDVGIDALGDVAINNDVTSGNDVNVSAGGAITSTGGTVSASNVDLAAVNGIGSAANPLALAATTLDAVNSGAGEIGLTNDNSTDPTVTVGSLTTTGDVTFTQTGTADLLIDTALAGNGGNITLGSGAGLTVTPAVDTAGGSLSATASHTADFAADIVTVGGDLTVTGGEVIFNSASGGINTDGSGGDIVVNAVTGVIFMGAVQTGGGNMDLAAGGDVSVQAAVATAGGDFSAAGDNVANTVAGTIDTGTGATGTGGTIEIVAADTVTIDGALQSGAAGVDGGAISVTASNASAAASGSLVVNADISTADGAGGTLTVGAGTTFSGGVIDVGAGNVTLEGNALDLIVNSAITGDYNMNLTAPRDIIVNALIGTSGSGDITLEADDDNDQDGGTLVQNIGAIDSAGFAVIKGSQINDVAGLGNAILLATAANTVDAGGNILILGKPGTSTGADVALGGAVASTGGHITILSANSVEQDANLTTDGGTIDVEAQSGDVLMGGTAATTSGDGNIRYVATSNVTLLALNAGTGAVSVAAGESILDENGAAVNVTAAAARFVAGDTVGDTVDDLLDADASVIAASAGAGGIGIGTQNDVTIGSVDAVTVSRVQMDGTALAESDAAALAGFTTAAGGHITHSVNGDLTVAEAVSADTTGNVRLDAVGISDLAVSNTVTSGSGSIVIGADNTLWQASDGDIQTGGAGTIRVAGSNGISMEDGAESVTADGDILYETLFPSDIVVGRLVAANGNVGVSSAGAIVDSGDTGGADIEANAATLVASGGIGATTDKLDTQVTVLEATSAAGSIFIGNTGSVVVDAPAAQPAANDVNVDGTLGGAVPLPGSGDLSTGIDGDIVLVGDNTITIGGGVSANGAGDVLLQTMAAGDVDLFAPVQSGSGSISLVAAGGVNVFPAGDVSTGGGTIDIDAGGSVFMGNGATTTSGGGNILIVAGTDAVLGGVDAGAGSVQVRAGADIIDGGDIDIDVTAGAASLVAGTAVGGVGAGALLDIEVTDVAAEAGAGGIFLDDTAGGVNVDTVAAFAVDRIGMDGATNVLNSLPVTGLVSSGSGDIVLQAQGGALTVNAPVTAPGSGHILLQAPNAGSDIVLETAGVTANGGDISVIAGRDVVMNPDGDITSLGTSSIDIEAVGGGITMSNGAQVVNNTSTILLTAQNDIVLGGVSTGRGRIRIRSTAGSILDGGDAHVDVVTGDASFLAPAGGVGDVAGSDPLETGIGGVAAQAGSAGVSLSDTGFINIDDAGALNVRRVDTNGVTSLIPMVSITGITTAPNGDIAVEAAAGIRVNAPVIAGGSGDILLQTLTSGDVRLASGVRSTSGNITLLAADDVTHENGVADVATGGAGTIDVEAQNGDIIMAAAARSSTGGGNIRYAATGSVALGTLDAGAGNVSVLASGGDVTDAGSGSNIVAAATRLDASNTIGATTDKLDIQVSTLAARAGAGGMYIADADAVTVDDVTAIAVNRVGMDGTFVSTQPDGALSDLVTTGGGNIILVAGDTITINDGTHPDNAVGVDADGSGNILLMTMGAGDIDVNAGVVSGSGSISILANDNVDLATAESDVSTGGGTIDIEATTGTISFNADTTLSSSDGNINLQSDGDLTITGIDAGAGTVTVASVSGSVLDGGDLAADITASAAALSAANAVGALTTMDSIDTTVGTVAAEAGAGGISLNNSSAVTIGVVDGSGVNRVLMDGTTTSLAASVSATGLVTSAGGHIVAKAGTGDLTVNSLVDADGAGNVLLQTFAGDVILDAAGVESDTGNIHLQGGTGIQQTADGDITTGGSGTILARTDNGGIIMADGAVSQTAGGDVFYSAFNGDVTLGSLDAGNGDVTVSASLGDIVDGGDTDTDVVGNTALLSAVGVGSTSNKIDTLVTTLAANGAAGGMYIANGDSVTVDDASTTAMEVDMDGTTGTALTISDSDLTTVLDGTIVLVADGFIQLNDGTFTADGNAVNAGGSGNVLLMTTNGGITANADVRLGTGNLTLDSDGAVLLASGADLVTGGAGTIDVRAADQVDMADGSLVSAGTGNVRVEAMGGDVGLAGITTAGDVAIVASGSILDNGDLATDIVAANALLSAGGTIGTTADRIDTEVAVITGAAGDGIFIEELAAGGDLEVGSVTFGGIERVAMDGTGANTGSVSGVGLTTTTNGSIVASVVNGSLTVNEAVAADGIGNVLLMTGGSGDITNNSTISSGTGSIDVTAAGDIAQNDDISTSGSGTIRADAGGEITMADGASSTTAGGDIQYAAGSNIVVGSLNAGVGTVLVDAGGSVLDGGDAETDVVAAELAVISGGDIDSSGGELDTQVSTLAADATGDVFIQNTGSVTVDTVAAISVDVVGMNGVATATPSGPWSDLAGNDLVLVADDTITVNDGIDGDGIGVDAATDGNVLLMTSNGDIDLNAVVQSADGNISVLANDNVSQATAGDILVGTAGDIDVEAANGAITMADGATAFTSGGNILYSGDGDVTLGGVTSLMNNVHVRSANGSILDGGDTDVDVTAVQASFQANNGGVGDVASMAYIDTEVTDVAAEAGSGGIALEDATAVNVAAVGTVTVDRVQMGATTVAASSDAIAGHTTASAGDIAQKTLAGPLTVSEAVTADTTGNVLLDATGGSAMVDAAVSSGSGNITVKSTAGITQGAAGDISTTGGDVVVTATGGDIAMDSDSRTTTGGGNIRYTAPGDVRITGLDAGAGEVSVNAGDSIVDAGEAVADVTAGAARLDAANAIGSSSDKFDTDVDTLAAFAGNGGMFIQNDGAVTVSDVGTVAAAEVQMDGTTADVQDAAALSDLVTGSNGDLVFVATDTITLQDGANADATSVSANGSGDVLIMTMGAGDIDVDDAIVSGSGNISVLATGNVNQATSDADITTAGGTIDVAASGGDVTMVNGAASTSGGGNIAYNASGDIVLGLLDAGAGLVSLTAGGGVSPAAGTVLNVDASSLLFDTGTGIGDAMANEFIETDIMVLAGQAGTVAGMAINNAGDLEIGTVGDVIVQRVAMDGSSSALTNAGFSGITAVDGAIEATTTDGDITVTDPINNAGGKVYLAATNGASNDIVVNNTITSGGSNVLLLAAADVLVSDDITAAVDVALWADTDGNEVGEVIQSTGVVEAVNGHLFVAGTEFTQMFGPSVLKAENGVISISVSNDLHLGGAVTGLIGKDIVADADNIFVDTVLTGRVHVVLEAREGSIVHNTAGVGQIRGRTLGLLASENVGTSVANPIQVASVFLGTFAQQDEFVVEEDDASAGLLIDTGFYPDSGPEWAEDIPRSFEDEAELIMVLQEAIEAEEFLDIVVPGNLTGGILLAGNNANMDIGGSVDLQQIKIGGLLTATVGLDFIVDTFMVDRLVLDVGRNGEVGSFMVTQDATATFGGNLSGNSMNIGGPLNLDVGGSWTYGSVELGSPTDNVTVGGDVDIGTLNEGGSLNITAGGSGTIDSFNVADNLNATFGGSLSGGSLTVGGLTDLKVGGDWTYDTVIFDGDANVMVDGSAQVGSQTANQNLTEMIGGSLSGGDLTVGGQTDLDVGNDWSQDSANFGGDADVMVGGSAEVTDLMAAGNLLAMIGNDFMGMSMDVGNDATLDVGGTWMYDTVNVGGLLDATVGGETKITAFSAGDLLLDTGSGLIGELLVDNDATITSGDNLEFDRVDLGGDAEFDIGDALTFNEFNASDIGVEAGSINMGAVNAGSVSMSAGGSINNNGSNIQANDLRLTAGSNIGALGSPITMNVGMISLLSGGGDVRFVQNKAGDTPVGLLRAGGTLTANVPNGGLVDKNGPLLNIETGNDANLNAQYLGTVSDALEVLVGGNVNVNGAGLSGDDPDISIGRIFVNLEGTINGSGRRISYVGGVPIPGLVLFNGQLLLGDQALLAEVFRTEAFVVETPEIKSPEGVFGDPYFIHLYMQISEAWNLFLDFILFGEADVNADPEMPPDAKRTIKIGGTEKPYAR